MRIFDAKGNRMYITWVLEPVNLTPSDPIGIQKSAAYAYWTGNKNSGGWLETE